MQIIAEQWKDIKGIEATNIDTGKKHHRLNFRYID